MRLMRRDAVMLAACMATVLTLAATAGTLRGQEAEATRGTPNVEVLSHTPLGAPMTVADLELEQELSRPYAYVARLLDAGFDVMDLSDPASPQVIYEWRIENA
jgi:hypothetical protein